MILLLIQIVEFNQLHKQINFHLKRIDQFAVFWQENRKFTFGSWSPLDDVHSRSLLGLNFFQLLDQGLNPRIVERHTTSLLKSHLIMKRSPIFPKTPMRSGAIAQSLSQRKAPARNAGLKAKQRTVSAVERLLWGRLASLGCIACQKDGHYNSHVSIHHVDGRTKPGCHLLVLPLCAGHHQAGTGEDKSLIAVHPDKARFEARYGTQRELLAECLARVEGRA